MTYYGTGIEVASAFDMKSALPVDGRAVAADLTERDAIVSGIRYEGMIVYVESEGKNYQLVGGITDGDWVELSSGSGGGSDVNPYLLSNLGMGFSVGSSALTVALKQADGSTDPDSSNPIKIAFRSSTVGSAAFSVRTIESARSITVPSGATLGGANGQDLYIHIYAIDTDGTDSGVELAVSASFVDEGRLLTTSAMGTSADDNDIYTASAETDRPIRYLGTALAPQTTAGTWTAVPTRASLATLKMDPIPQKQYLSVLSSATSEQFTNGSPVASGCTMIIPPGHYRIGYKARVEARISGSVTNKINYTEVTLRNVTTSSFIPNFNSFVSLTIFSNAASLGVTASAEEYYEVNQTTTFELYFVKDEAGSTTSTASKLNGQQTSFGVPNTPTTFIWAERVPMGLG